MGRVIKHDYDKEKHKAVVEVYDHRYGGIRGKGTASVHEEDKEFASTFTGLTIAGVKADSEFYRKRSNAKRKRAEALIAQGKSLLESAEQDMRKHEGSKEYLEYYIQNKDKLYRAVEAKREREEKFGDIEFEDLGDLTRYMTIEEKLQAEKEIQEGMLDKK